MFSTAFTWRYATDHFSAVLNCTLRVKSTLTASKSLTDDFSVFIDQNRHVNYPAALTAC